MSQSAAWIGLGVMGYPMAGHLKNKGGIGVTVFNRTAEKSARWAGQFKDKTAPTPAEAAKGADMISDRSRSARMALSSP